MTFDLEKARAVCKTLPKYMNGACPCKEEAEAAKMLIKALPEIERLRDFRGRVARILKQPLTDCDDLLILGLDARLCQLRRQTARIQEMEDALAEYQRLGKIMEGRLPCLTLHGDCDRCSPRAKEVCEAMHQITEDKIGPDAETGNRDHVVGPDQMVPCWQITEDRVTAIDQGLRFLEWSNAKTGNVETKKRIAILKTMLEEASDEHGFER